MSSGDFFEFSIAHDRKYTLDHLWVQVLDDDEDDIPLPETPPARPKSWPSPPDRFPDDDDEE